jgi:hypothetical protein
MNYFDAVILEHKTTIFRLVEIIVFILQIENSIRELKDLLESYKTFCDF